MGRGLKGEEKEKAREHEREHRSRGWWISINTRARARRWRSSRLRDLRAGGERSVRKVNINLLGLSARTSWRQNSLHPATLDRETGGNRERSVGEHCCGCCCFCWWLFHIENTQPFDRECSFMFIWIGRVVNFCHWLVTLLWHLLQLYLKGFLSALYTHWK